jgi:hypothetical protein
LTSCAVEACADSCSKPREESDALGEVGIL